MKKFKFEKKDDDYSQNAWNNTLITKLNELNGSVIKNDDVISASYIFKDLFNTLTWLEKPIIKYRFDNKHSIFINNIELKIEDYPYNHQENEEWIESQKNVFNNLDTQYDGMYPEYYKNKETFANYLDDSFSSGREIMSDDIIYCGLLYDKTKNTYTLIYFHIDELKGDNNIYEYHNNDNNDGLLPKLTLI